MYGRLPVLTLLIAGLFALYFIAGRPTPDARAATAPLLSTPAATACSADGSGSVAFSWTPAENAKTQYLDITRQDNGFAAGTFVTAGPFAGSVSNFTFNGIRSGAPHFWRISTELEDGSWVGTAGSFTSCGTSATFWTGSQTCTGTSAINVGFRWAPMAVTGALQWLDVGYDPSFAATTYSGIGPMDAQAQSYQWNNLDGNVQWYVRLTTLTPDGAWYVSPSVPFAGNCNVLNSGIYSSSDRLVYPRVGINAPVNVQDVPDDARLGVPLGAYDVVRYNFARFSGFGGYPGAGGTVMVSGHVDYYEVGLAVFAPLRQAEPGDVIEYHRWDGIVVTYVVDWVSDVLPGYDWTGLSRSSSPETIALITCNGQFDYDLRQYSHRRVVHGVIASNG